MYIIVYLVLGLLTYGLMRFADCLLPKDATQQDLIDGFFREMQIDGDITIEEAEEASQKVFGTAPVLLVYIVLWPIMTTGCIIMLIGYFKNKKD